MPTLHIVFKSKARLSIFNPKKIAAIATSMDIGMQRVKKSVHSFTPCIEKVSRGWYGRKCQEGKTQRMHSCTKGSSERRS